MDAVPETELTGHPQAGGELRYESQDSGGRVLGTASRNSMLERATLEPACPKGLLEDYLHLQDFHEAQACRDQKPAAYICLPLSQKNARTSSIDLIAFRQIEPKKI